LKHTSEDQEDIRCWSRCGCRTAVGVIVSERHVVKEVVDVGEEVVVGEDVVLVSVRDEELASSRAERSPKTLSPLSRTGSQETGFRMGKTVRQRKALEAGGNGGCVLAERSDLSFIATEGGE
jgi:hypothetical protein